jgi:hypothetical protein
MLLRNAGSMVTDVDDNTAVVSSGCNVYARPRGRKSNGVAHGVVDHPAKEVGVATDDQVDNWCAEVHAFSGGTCFQPRAAGDVLQKRLKGCVLENETRFGRGKSRKLKGSIDQCLKSFTIAVYALKLAIYLQDRLSTFASSLPKASVLAPFAGAAAKPGDCCVFCSYGSVPCPPAGWSVAQYCFGSGMADPCKAFVTPDASRALWQGLCFLLLCPHQIVTNCLVQR